MASSGFCALVFRGVICPTPMALTKPAAFGSFDVKVQVRGIGILEAISNEENADIQMNDSSIVRVHQHGDCVKHEEVHYKGRSRGGLTTKMLALVDRQGLPLQLTLTAGQQHDSLLAPQLTSSLRNKDMLLADRLWPGV